MKLKDAATATDASMGKVTPSVTVMERPWVEEKEAVLETEVEVPTVNEREEEMELPVTPGPACAVWMLETATWRPAVSWESPLSILQPAQALSMHALSVDEHSPRLPMSAAARAAREPEFLVETVASGTASFYEGVSWCSLSKI